MIDILVPVLGRPQNAQPLVSSIDRNTKVPHTTVFVCTRGDEAQIEACKQTGCVVHLVDDGDHQYARKINAGIAADYGRGDFFFLAADDLKFHPRWDVKAIAAFENAGAPVVGTNDMGNATVIAGRHSTHTLVHRSYLERGTVDDPTVLLHEGYHHNFVDTEFIETAKWRRAFVSAYDSRVEHLHPFWRKAPDDVIYRRGRVFYHEDGELFKQRSRLWRGRAT
jgi:hypothetical protein